MTSQERIGALDGWRGVAILLVLADHAGETSNSSAIHAATRVGATGVGIFFALSGFLITSLLLAEKRKLGRIRLGDFYRRRFFRIVPPVLVFLAALLLLRRLGLVPVTNLQVLSSIFLFRNYLHSDWGAGWYTGHLWSLTVEEHFYLFWPLLLIATRARLRPLVALALSVAAWRAVSLHYHFLAGPWAPGRTDIRIDSLLWGCIVAIVLTRPGLRDRFKRGFTVWILLFLILVDIGSNIGHRQHNYSFYEPVILALLVVWPVLHPKSVLRRLLDAPLLKFVGTISYSLYIWQEMWLLFPRTPVLFPRMQAFPVNIVMAFCCAIASYYLVEKPFIGLGRRLTARAPGAAAPSAPSFHQIAAADPFAPALSPAPEVKSLRTLQSPSPKLLGEDI